MVHDKPIERSRVHSRRRFLADTARITCGVGFFGLAHGLYSKQVRSLPATALRPPGALSEEQFLGACVRCGQCVRGCPYPTLGLAEMGGEVTVGTPYFTAREAPCEMCEDIPCVAACPTGALSPELTDIDDARMGLAVLSDQETCLNFLGLRCEVCYRVCPLIDKAITLEMQSNLRTGLHAMIFPKVHSQYCTGCGKCERACVLEESAIKVLPMKLVKGKGGKHDRFGWVEKEKAGKPLVPGVVFPTPRLPGARP